LVKEFQDQGIGYKSPAQISKHADHLKFATLTLLSTNESVHGCSGTSAVLHMARHTKGKKRTCPDAAYLKRDNGNQWFLELGKS